MVRNQSGLSLVELMMALGISGVITLGILEFTNVMHQMAGRTDAQTTFESVMGQVQRTVSEGSKCQSAFQNQDGLAATVNSLEASSGFPLQVGDQIGTQSLDLVQITDIRLRADTTAAVLESGTTTIPSTLTIEAVQVSDNTNTFSRTFALMVQGELNISGEIASIRTCYGAHAANVSPACPTNAIYDPASPHDNKCNTRSLTIVKDPAAVPATEDYAVNVEGIVVVGGSEKTSDLIMHQNGKMVWTDDYTPCLDNGSGCKIASGSTGFKNPYKDCEWVSGGILAEPNTSLSASCPANKIRAGFSYNRAELGGVPLTQWTAQKTLDLDNAAMTFTQDQPPPPLADPGYYVLSIAVYCCKTTALFSGSTVINDPKPKGPP